MHWSAREVSKTRLTKSNGMKELSQSENILSFVACQGLVRYLRICYGHQTPKNSGRMAIVIAAFRIWQGLMYLRSVPLPDRIDTLLFFLTHVTKPEDSVCRNTLWDIALNDIVPNLQMEEYLPLVGVLFTTAQSPHEIIPKIQSIFRYQLENWAFYLQNSGDLVIRDLGHTMRVILEINMAPKTFDDIPAALKGKNTAKLFISLFGTNLLISSFS